MQKGQRVFIVDYDSCSPLGIGNENIMKSIHDNYSAGNTITSFSTEGLGATGAAEVRGDLAKIYANELPQIKKMAHYDKKLELMVANYHLMKTRLEKMLMPIPEEKKGVILGLGLDVTPLETIQAEFFAPSTNPAWNYINAIEKLNYGQGRVNTLLNPLDISAIYLAEKLGLAAFQKTILTACTASTQAIIYATRALQTGEVEAVLAGGTDSIINLMAYLAFGKLGVMSTSSEHPSKYCKPLDLARRGTLIGEAAGLSLLANEEAVSKYSLPTKFEIIGMGNTLDGYKITAPDPKGLGMKAAIGNAVASAQISAEQIDYINLHGTGTLSNDEIELQSIVELFEEKAANISVSSTKSRHGHAIAAAGIQEFNLLMSCMEENIVPYNLNLENPISVTHPIDIVMHENKKKNLNIGMTNNFAFGGVNSSIIIKKVSYGSSITK